VRFDALATLGTEVRTPITITQKTVWGHRANVEALEERKALPLLDIARQSSEENETGMQT
jgi:hypothetical protein